MSTFVRLVVVLLLFAGVGWVVERAPGPEAPIAAPSPTGTPSQTALPLAGRRIALDPGHQLGNASFPAQINRPVPDGRGSQKACNTTGTATDAGLPEATVVWEVARQAKRQLEQWGAQVVMTRTSNSISRWGPCVDARGRFATARRAEMLVSLHADGAEPGLRGFHVITVPEDAASRRLALGLRAGLDGAGLPRAAYVAEGLDERTDLATLNLSGVPSAMVEIGNMRNRADAALMSSRQGRGEYAAAVAAGIRSYLTD